MFLQEDTAAALALAQEERDTCSSCGYPKAFCRTPNGEEGLARFDVVEERCWATYRVALRQQVLSKEAHPETQAATQMWPKFREGHEPDLLAGIDLADRDDQD